MPTGRSLHIGLNSVDPGHYADWSGPLSACVNDALDMDAVAQRCGFQTTVPLSGDATRDTVLGALTKTLDSLVGGDLLLVAYSGHGGQVPDRNGDEKDGKDETWCLHDGELLADELWKKWVRAALRVRIVVLSDSCNRGTTTKALQQSDPLGGSRTPKSLTPTLAGRVYRKHGAYLPDLA